MAFSKDDFAEEFGGVMTVTLVWGFLFYAYAFMQGQVKTGKMLPGSDSYKYFLDRNFGNMFEQSTIFLLSMWVYAASVSADDAAKCGWAWLFFRLLYAVIWGSQGTPSSPPTAIAASTLPAYFVVIFLLVTPALHHGLIFGLEFNLQSHLGGWLAPSVFITGFLTFVLCMMTSMAFNKAAAPGFKYDAVSEPMK